MALALRKAVADCEAGSGLKNFTKELQAVSPKMVGTLDFESIKALTGKINWTSKEELDAPIAVLKYFTKGWNCIFVVSKALAKIANNPIGKEAVQEEIEKVVVHVAQDDTKNSGFACAYKVEKNGKELHVTLGRDWPSQAKDSNSSCPGEDDLAKIIEAML